MMKSIFKNWELKILALLSAIILWFFVVGIENNSYRFPEDIQVHAVNIPPGMSISNDLGKANIRIRADEDVLKTLTSNDFDISVDLKNTTEAERDLPLLATSINDKVTILKVEPATVHVILEPITDNDIKVKAVVIGNPAKGYSVTDAEVNPAVVTVSGGKSLLNKLTSLNAEIKLDGSESSNFKENIILKLPDNLSSQKNVTMVPQQVTAEVTITQDIQQKTVTVNPNVQGLVDANVLAKKLIVTPQTITIQGKQAVLDAIPNIETELVSYETLKNALKPIKAKLIVPPGVTLADPQSNTVLLSLTAS